MKQSLFHVANRTEDVLHIKSNKTRHISGLFGYGLFFTAWYSALYKMAPPTTIGDEPFVSLFWFSPIVTIPEIIRSLGVIAFGESYRFDKSKACLVKDDRKV